MRQTAASSRAAVRPGADAAHALAARGALRHQAHTRLVRRTLRAPLGMITTTPATRAIARLEAPRSPDQGPLAALEHFGPARWLPPTAAAIGRAHDALPILLRHLCGEATAPYEPHEITVISSTAAPELTGDALYGAALKGIERHQTLYPLLQEADAWALRERLGLWSMAPWHGPAGPIHPVFAVRGTAGTAAWLEVPGHADETPLPLVADAAACVNLRQSLVMSEADYLLTANADDLLIAVRWVPDLVWVVRAHAPLREPRPRGRGQ